MRKRMIGLGVVVLVLMLAGIGFAKWRMANDGIQVYFDVTGTVLEVETRAYSKADAKQGRSNQWVHVHVEHATLNDSPINRNVWLPLSTDFAPAAPVLLTDGTEYPQISIKGVFPAKRLSFRDPNWAQKAWDILLQEGEEQYYQIVTIHKSQN